MFFSEEVTAQKSIAPLENLACCVVVNGTIGNVSLFSALSLSVVQCFHTFSALDHCGVLEHSWIRSATADDGDVRRGAPASDLL